MNFTNLLGRHYDIIYTDPPWPQTKGGAKAVRPNSSGTSLNYNTMTLEDIWALHHDFFEQHLTPDKCGIFVWTIEKFLPQTEEAFKKMGYQLHCRFVWDKVTGIPAAFTVRFSHEYLLWLYPKGRMLKTCDEQRGKFSTVMREQVTRHSQKPECAYLMLEAMFPEARKVELFARKPREGWDCWGDEV